MFTYDSFDLSVLFKVEFALDVLDLSLSMFFFLTGIGSTDGKF